jgi:O-antigen ligase
MTVTSFSRDIPWPALLVLAVLVLLPVGRGADVPLVIGGIVAVVLVVRRRLDIRDPQLRLAFGLFACYWLPALFSVAGAVDPGKTGSTIASALRFLPFALFSIWALRDATVWPAVTTAIAGVLVLWALDAYVQMGTGFSIGGPAEAERVSGIFGAGNLKLGPALSVLSPFVLTAARSRFGWKGLALAFVLLVPPILLAGSRAAWVSYALVGLFFAWRETRRPLRFVGVIVCFAAILGAIGALALHDSTRFGARIERSLLALRGTDAALDDASAGRLSIWRTAVAMGETHPLTGVGVRGFRYAYPTYAAPGDRFVDTKTDTGASHAHQILLEVISETGGVGLSFWLVGAWLALRAWLRADAAARSRAFAPGLALVAMCFPLNTHLAFYSAWWGLLFWWLLALYTAALAARDNRTASAS